MRFLIFIVIIFISTLFIMKDYVKEKKEFIDKIEGNNE
jgi:hypothetical protein